MIVKVFEIERPTFRERFLHHSDLNDVELFGDTVHSVADELQTYGRAWIGGGPDRLFYLTIAR